MGIHLCGRSIISNIVREDNIGITRTSVLRLRDILLRMIKTYTSRNLSWIDMESPTSDDVSVLLKDHPLNPLVGEELLSPTRKSKIDVHDDYLFLVLHIPVRVQNGKGKSIQEKEIDFVIGEDFIVTSHYGVVEPLHTYAKTFETNSILEKKQVGNHAGIIFYYIMKHIYGEMMHDLENIKDSLTDAEKNIFQGQERTMVQALSLLSREIIDYKQTVRMHKEVLESFSDIPKGFFDKDFAHFLEDMRDTYASIHDSILSNKELLTDLRETNDSLLSTKQNEHMKLFSILAFVTFPLSLLVSLFALPTSHTPIIGRPFDWEIIALGVLTLALIMYAYFKEKGWL